MPFEWQDLREWLARVEALGELRTIRGVDWDREMGGVVEICCRQLAERLPALLFDEIPGYRAGYRCLYAMLNSPRRFALTMGMPLDIPGGTMGYLRAFRERMKAITPVPARVVDHGPILENVDEGTVVDLLKFPVPVHHELDGGRYIGTADAVVTMDPESGWVNLGTYRMQVVDRQAATLYISPGKHGRLHLDRYFEAGRPCPVVAIVGIDPLLWVPARYQVPYGVSEYDYAGGIRGEPVAVLQGKTGVPIPANAEIVLEGEVHPGDTHPEGPFGEWPGYYAGGERPEPVMRVTRVLYRDDPILTCAASNKPPHAHLFERCFIRSAGLWDGLERGGVPNVRGVWVHEAGAGRTFIVISIKQSYYGHSRHAGILASQMSPAAYIGRWVIVVDDDIDPSSMYEVLWAMGTRCDPATDIEIQRKCWSSKIDPLTFTEHYYNSRAVVDACIPYEHRHDFPKVAVSSRELRARLIERYPAVFREILGTIPDP
ncbi:MAG: UbiD family decarboxylase [Deltaproteobacteria bacterium]|nr:UbiD family decarboxylase [Deltaproteobacteria bacterium]MBI3077486.1 UbiD family decarboxylase [Deltaproteobacteria bacterium]